MGIELVTLIAVMGTVYSGNPLSLDPGFSIGGESSKVGNILGDLFGLLGMNTLNCPLQPYTENIQEFPAAYQRLITSSKPMLPTRAMMSMSRAMRLL